MYYVLYSIIIYLVLYLYYVLLHPGSRSVDQHAGPARGAPRVAAAGVELEGTATEVLLALRVATPGRGAGVEISTIQGRHMDTIWTEKFQIVWNSTPERSGGSPGQEIKPLRRNWRQDQPKIFENSKN